MYFSIVAVKMHYIEFYLGFQRLLHDAPWFFLRLWRFINHLLTYLLTYYTRTHKESSKV